MPPENERRSRRRRRVSVRRSTSTSRRTRRGRPSMGLVDRRVADAHASRSVPSVLTCTTSTGTVPIRSSPAERTHRAEPDDGRSSRRRRRSPSTIRRSRGHGWTMAVPSYPRVLISFGSCTCGQIWLERLLLPCSDRDGSSGVSVEAAAAAAVSLAAGTSNHSNQFHDLLLLDPTG